MAGRTIPYGVPESAFDVVVAGGGLSGLSVAAAVSRHLPGARILCLEADARPGGVIGTVSDRGFLIESGPAGFLDKTGSVRRLAASLGIEGELIASDDSQRVRWISHNGRLERFPSSIREFLTSNLLSARGKLRMLTEPLRSSGAGEETVASFATRRLGKEAAELMVDPIVSGIYAADASQLSLQASMPHLAALEKKKKSLLVSFLRASGTVRPLMSFRGGCAQLVSALRERLDGAPNGAIECESPVEEIVQVGGGYIVRIGGTRPRQVRCRSVISAAPAHAASRYLKSVDPEIAFQLAQVRYASVAVVALGYRVADVPRPLTGFGYLVPGREGTPVLGVQWSSSIYPGHRAPKDACLLRLFLGGAPAPMLARQDEESLAALAREELEKTLGITAPPALCHVKRHLEAMPQYLVEHNDRVADITRRAGEHAGLFVGGNGLRGLGMDAIVSDAEILGRAATDYTRSAPTQITRREPAAERANPEAKQRKGWQ